MTEDTATAEALGGLDIAAGTGSLLVAVEWFATVAGLEEIEVTRELVAARERIEAARRDTTESRSERSQPAPDDGRREGLAGSG